MNKSKILVTTNPVIFWHSDPVRPDETVVIQGEDFSSDAVVELAAIPNSGSESEPKWEKVTPLQSSGQSLKAVIPAGYAPGLYRCRVSQEQAVSNEVTLNAPDIWWIHGDEGRAKARSGGWLRVFGKCLNLGGASQVTLCSPKGEKFALSMTESSGYCLRAEIPATLAPGTYEVSVHNGTGGDAGWRRAADVEVLEARLAAVTTLNVLDFGADPDGLKDCTLAIVRAFEHLSAHRGGVVYFPRGRYRIDSILRSGMWISHPLKVPPGVTMRGEGMHLVSLWWPDQKEPLPTLIEGSSDFGVEDLSIYTQGRHHNIISGESNARIRRVRIRANCHYAARGPVFHGRRRVDQIPAGAAVEFSGSNIEITECDIYHSNTAFALKHVRGGLVANNTCRAGHLVCISGGSEIIFENNSFEGNQLDADGNNIALFFGAASCRHVYYAHNRVAHIYGGDHETLTFDGHGTAYIGRVRKVRGTEVTLASSPVLGDDGFRDNMVSMNDTTLYILSGRGAGQYRAVASYSDRDLKIDRPWLVEPDESSVVSIGAFNGRHLVIGNEAEDSGTLVQLYPPNCECIVAENRGIHCGGIGSLSKLGRNENSRYQRVEPSWFNQFLDNHTVWGNAWGGGETEIDRWLGGEGYLNIWGWQVAFRVDQDGNDQDRQLTQDDVAKLLNAAPESVSCIPLSRGQIVRRHLIDNNSSIRIRGAVVDVLVEKCVIKEARRGIRVDNEVKKQHTEHLDMLTFEPEPEIPAPGQPQPFLSPKGVLLRKNEMHHVRVPYSGTALEFARCEKGQ